MLDYDSSIYDLAPPFLIVSDSLSALSASLNVHSTHPPVTHILILLTTLSSIPLSIKFMWVPSHTGIQGNESVDSAVKTATNLLRIEPSFLPTKSDLTLFIRKLSQTPGFSFGRNRPLPMNLLKLNPYLSPGLRLTKHIAIMKSTSHVSASVTLVLHMLTFSSTYSPFHVNIAVSTHLYSQSHVWMLCPHSPTIIPPRPSFP